MPLKNDTVMPSLTEATQWYNGDVDGESLSGSVTLIHFWSVSCGICSEQMPTLNRWRETYAGRGFRLVGVHKPRSEKDTDLARVQEAVTSYGFQHPIAVDNTHAIVDRFKNDGVPEFFLYDADRRLRLNVVGDQGLESLEKMILLLTRAAQLQAQER